ncbi:hypothetical protein KC331_g228 [Hortaea werneckii]|nr:hypothetical protein KC331_g228 [Hortaea werneckii]KAI7722706.1 hypothetical protein KC353_g265 [Hortaea werneckii]
MDAQKLRGLPHEPELFCKRTAAEQNRFSVKDQNPDYEVRELPTHETTTMALNVLAAAHGRGFFLHLPSKSSLTSFPSAERLPAQRRIAQSGTGYPNMVFMDMVWDDAMRDRFRNDTPRGRYLRCHALVNPPPGSTPMFAIQCVASSVDSPSDTDTPSLILVSTPPTYYLLSTTKVADVFGRTRRSADKLSVPRLLWETSQLHTGRDAAQRKKQHQFNSIQADAKGSVAEVYRAVIQQCCGLDRSLASTFTMLELRGRTPRPDPGMAASVGKALGGGRSADPPSRRLEIRKSHGRKRRRSDAAWLSDDQSDKE